MSRLLSSLPSNATLMSPPRIVINTRPVERAAPLTCHLQAAGFTVVEMPMLALQPHAVNEADMTMMRRWLAGDYQALVIVSPTAAASGLAVWQALKNEHQTPQSSHKAVTAVDNVPSHIIAVGQATAAVLNGNELLPVDYEIRQPIIANNEGMLAMPEIDGLQAGDKLLVWRGLGGRRLLVDTLYARGVHIDSIAWYERTMPEAASAQYQHWQQQFNGAATQSQQPKPVVIVSSGTAFEHWLTVVEDAQISDFDTSLNLVTPLTVADFAYIVLGVRLAEMVAERQLDYWQVEDLAPETILATLQPQ